MYEANHAVDFKEFNGHLHNNNEEANDLVLLLLLVVMIIIDHSDLHHDISHTSERIRIIVSSKH